MECFSEAELVRLQNAIVEERYAERGFRTDQVQAPAGLDFVERIT